MRDILTGQDVLVVDCTPVSLITVFNSVTDLLLVTVNITSGIRHHTEIQKENVRNCNSCNC
jgi:hypothetical protein